MSDSEKIRKYEWIVPVVLIVAAFFGGDYYGQRKVEKSLVAETDTITKVVAVYKDFPEPVKSVAAGMIPVPKCMFFTDSVPVAVPGPTDTQYVYLPREQKYYEEDEGRLRMWISGYDPMLDRYELDDKTVTITNTIYRKPSRWSFSITAGWGATYDFRLKNLATGPSVVVGASYTFLWL